MLWDHAALDAATTVHVRWLPARSARKSVRSVVVPALLRPQSPKFTAVRETARDHKGAIQPHGITLK
jgi:hypothetical protein